jgi:hypothetical protein
VCNCRGLEKTSGGEETMKARTRVKSGRCTYSYFGGSFITIPRYEQDKK